MKKLQLLSLAAITLVIAVSCGNKKEGEGHSLHASIGQPSEVVLVMDQPVMNSDVKDSLVAMLTANVPGLNQGEDFFRTSKIPASMDGGEFYALHSRIIVKLDKSKKEVQLGTARNVYANPQLQVQISGPSIDALRTYIQSHQDQIRDMLLDAQLNNQASYLRRHHSDEVLKGVKNMFGYTIDAPDEIKSTKKGKDFLWGSSGPSDKQISMVFYRLPYTGQDLSDPKVMATLRDSVMKANIPGSQPDQYMATTWEKENPIVLMETKKMGDQPVSIMRGLWEMHNGAMGGPFVSYARLEKDKQTILVTEGFVFSPGTAKRDLVRRLEAAMRTLKK